MTNLKSPISFNFLLGEPSHPATINDSTPIKAENLPPTVPMDQSKAPGYRVRSPASDATPAQGNMRKNLR